ncbi:MAG: catechol 1,2-dioxygenase [Sphingomonadales bacterium]|jgi:catechol 1,2-dioxygenase|nr:catechol 1,2-dioxygenase [Sphingomonadales bacterium]
MNERAKELVDAMVDAVRKVIAEKQIDYDEYRAGVDFMVQLANSGEIPLLAAVLLETSVDEVMHASSRSSTTAIRGPYYVPDAPLLTPPVKLPRRSDEPGDTLLISGTVRDPDGNPLRDAELDMWQATGETPGRYSNVHPGLPDFNLRGRFHSKEHGGFEVETVVPAPYQIHSEGPTGELFERIGRSTWRPAHLHFTVRHPGYQTLTAQLFFTDDTYLDSDAANAVKGDLIITLEKPDRSDTGGEHADYHAHYDFVLEPSP